jgi:hypothetical protein
MGSISDEELSLGNIREYGEGAGLHVGLAAAAAAAATAVAHQRIVRAAGTARRRARFQLLQSALVQRRIKLREPEVVF